MPHRVEIAPAAARDLRSLPVRARQRIEPVILALADQSRPSGARKLQAQERAYRVRVGDYRVIYEVYDEERLVVVLRVARRSEASYKRL